MKSEHIISLCVCLFMIILCVAACSAGGDPEDNSAWNSIIAIGLILAWLKGK